MEHKRIMVITSHTPSLICFRMDMILDFHKRGYDVIAVGQESEEKWEEKFEGYGISYFRIPIDRNGINPFRDLRTINRIRELYRKIKPQKVFLYQAKPVVYGSVAAACCPEVEIFSLIAGLGSVFRGTSWKSRMLRSILKWEYRYALRKNSIVMFHNQDDLQQFQKWRIVQESQCRCVHGSGVNAEKFAHTKLPDGPTVFLMIARIIRDKGVMEYLEASRIVKRKYPEIKCMLVGPYDTNPSALGEEDLKPYFTHVEYYGEQKDVRPFIKQCTTYILPSYHEGLPKSVLEAMSMGRAVITTDAPGCRDTVIDGENGFLVPVKDFQKLAERMEYMVLHPELQRAMGTKSRELVVEKYDVVKVNGKIAEIMQLDSY